MKTEKQLWFKIRKLRKEIKEVNAALAETLQAADMWKTMYLKELEKNGENKNQ